MGHPDWLDRNHVTFQCSQRNCLCPSTARAAAINAKNVQQGEIHSFYMLRWCPPEHWSILVNLMDALENGHHKKSGNCFMQGWTHYWEVERRWGGLWYKQMALRAILCSFGEHRWCGPCSLNTGIQRGKQSLNFELQKPLTSVPVKCNTLSLATQPGRDIQKNNIPGLQYILNQNCFSLHKS